MKKYKSVFKEVKYYAIKVKDVNEKDLSMIFADYDQNFFSKDNQIFSKNKKFIQNIKKNLENIGYKVKEIDSSKDPNSIVGTTEHNAKY